MIHRGTHRSLACCSALRGAGSSLLALLFLSFSAVSFAGDDLPTTLPILDELNRETQALFKQTSPSVVRVQLPMPSETAGDDPMNKWSARLDPEVRRRLEQIQQSGPGEVLVREDIVPSTLPSDPAQDSAAPHMIVMQLRSFVPNSVGVVIDDQRHVLVPQYVDPSQFSASAMVMLPDGSLTPATFVGSDQRTELTVLKLRGGDVKAAILGSGDLMPGTLLMVLSLNPAFNRLTVWQRGQPDAAALIGLDGEVVGFTGAEGFVPAAGCLSLAQELIDHGHIRRAYLGVAVRAVAADDPLRQLDAALGQTPALEVAVVVPGSAADKSGMKPRDLILQLDGQDVGGLKSFADAVAKRQGPTPILILRDGQRVAVTVDLQIQ